MSDVAEQLKQALAFIEHVGAELLNRRCTDWYPEGANNAALAMCNDMGSLADECIQFDVGPVEKPQPTGPTVRCRIAVCVNEHGSWAAFGVGDPEGADSYNLDRMRGGLGLLDDGDRVSFIEADVPLPQRVEPAVVQGRIVSQGDTE